jgi:hypothetical protein
MVLEVNAMVPLFKHVSMRDAWNMIIICKEVITRYLGKAKSRTQSLLCTYHTLLICTLILYLVRISYAIPNKIHKHRRIRKHRDFLLCGYALILYEVTEYYLIG